MLGFEALGRIALGQISATNAIDLVASQASFALTGQAATLKATEVVANGAFALSGKAVSFKFGEVVGQGAYTLMGEATTFLGSLTAAQGGFALTGFAVTEEDFFTASGGTYTLTGLPALDSVDFNRDSVGSSISGGTFSRKRWRDMLDQEERERAAEARKIAHKKLRRRSEEHRRQLADADRRRAAREASKAEGEALAGALALAHHEAAARGMDRLRAVAHAAGAQAAIGRSASSIGDDDEGVIALIMAMHQ
jgi:hypothetical protein